MKKYDLIFLILGLIFCVLVWFEFFTGGYDRGLTVYNVFIARLWAFLAAVSLFYSIISFNAERQTRKTNIILLFYSIITIAVIIYVIFAEI
ncbi:MAG: hypothetical protein N2114_06510 [Candidatus Goldbacteria bacterium]|nr:hypothetical protein [Candidatus Goldiibacteriota bacterium]